MSEERAESCSGCAADGGRRAFLREAAAAAAAALVALGIPGRAAAAMPIAALSGTRRGVGGGVTYPIPAADGVSIDKANEVILVRHGGSVYAFALSCPHQNTALRWNADEGRFQCPKHKSRYQPDGTFISGRATRNMDRLPIRREGGNVVVDVDRMFESDKDEAGWKAAVVAL
ncbi:MAG: Rieske (2Fe-2S) protein [Gemmatimonadetes bacterium]|nr:Rieske (2Fe-2S) protein [Gemmatimonadota bacterium]MCC7133780.1 Rieske (2Fe-2S) protein [Gemmatimonadales bacterium]